MCCMSDLSLIALWQGLAFLLLTGGIMQILSMESARLFMPTKPRRHKVSIMAITEFK